MGDSSVSSDSAGDRSISPSRWEEPAPPTPPTAASNSPTPPSPVLVSKRLAEEAVLKRNSQLLIKEEASSRTSKTSPQMINGRPAITRTTAKSTKKRPAPLPPGHQRAPEVSSHLHPPSPATAVSAASASSRSSAASGRYGLPVSSSSEKPESARLSAPTTYSNYSPNLSATMAYHPPSSSASHSASGGMNGSRYHSTSNLESTPSVSISNLTHVSSSSNGSLASAIRKRKAPGPPSITEKDPSAPRQRMANLINPAWGSESVASDDVELKPEAAENVPVVKASASPTSSTRRDVVSKGAVALPSIIPRKVKPAPPLPMDANNNVDDADDDLLLDDDHLEMFNSRAEVEAINRNVEEQQQEMNTSNRKWSDASFYSCLEPEEFTSRQAAEVKPTAALRRPQAAIPDDLSFVDVAALQTPLRDAPRRSFSAADLLDVAQPTAAADRNVLRCVSVDATTVAAGHAETPAASSILPPLSNSCLSKANDWRRRGQQASSTDDSEDVSVFFSTSSSSSSSTSCSPSSTPVGPRRHNKSQPVAFNSYADSDEETEVETETEAGATGKAEGEEDYEVLDFQRKAGIADEECCQANSQVEVVKPEPLYTMVVKSPKSIRATDVHKEDIRLPASAQSDSDYSIREEANPTESAQLPDEPEVVGGIAEVSAESPILWEYKLPAPPPAFTDTVTSHSSTAPEDTSTSGSTSDADSSISIDSLQIENRTDVELKPEVPLATVKMDDKPEVRPESIEANAQPEELQEATQVAGPKPEVVVDSVEKEMKPEVVVDPVEKEMKPEVRQEPIQTECKREEEAQPVQVEVKPETKAKPEHKDLKPEEKNGSLMMNFKPKRSVLNEFIPLGSIVVDCKPEVLVEPIQHPHPETLTLNEGSDLQGETTTEDAVSTNEAPEAEASLPPCSPSRLDDEEELESPQELPDKPEMRFSISTYHRRVKKEGLSYDKKLIRSESFSTTQQPKTRTLTSTGSLDTPTPTPMLTSDTTSSQSAQPIQPLPVTTLPSPDQPVKDTEPEIVAETEQPEVTEAVPAAVPVSLPISVDLIQQFQNALHNTSDPGARALQEEFLRLQQQFLTWQTQAALQQQSTASTASADDPSPKDPRPVAAPSATPLAASAAHELSPIEEVSMESSVGSPEREQDQSTPVKVETWQAGRPQSTVVDHSRSAVFSALKTDPAPILETQPIPAAQTVQPIPSPRSIIPSTDDKTDPAEVPELDPTPVNTPETEVTNDDTAVRNNLPVVRKASFLTARPFDPNRPVQFPIKRPNFSPMVIHPVPAVSRRFHQPNGRAPEVRGFASIPYSDGEPPAEKQTMFIRNQLIQSAKRPSGEWHTNGQEVQLRNSLHKEPVEEANEEKPPRPFSMPVSSSLLLAAARNGTPSPPPPPPPPPTTTIHEDDPVSILSLKRVSLRPVDANGRGGRPQSVPPKFETEINPRDQLLQSIRDFGHNGTLRKMGTDPN